MRLPPAMASSVILRHIAALALFMLLAWLFYRPPPMLMLMPTLGLDPRYLGLGNDPLAFIWFLNWWPFALWHHLDPFITSYVDAPVGRSLAWCTSIPALALLAAPVTAGLGTVTAYNMLMLASGGLAGWAAYLAGFALAGSWPAALAGGLLFGFSSYQLGQQLGHLNLSFTALLPLGLWLCLAAARRGWPPPWLGLWLGLLLALQFGVSQEVLASGCLFGGLFFALAYCAAPASRPALRRLLPGCAIAAAIGLLLAAPLLWQMLRQYGAARSGFQHPADFSADLLAFAVPTPLIALGGHAWAGLAGRFPGNFSEEGGYLGLPLTVLLLTAAVTGWRRPAMRVSALFILLAALLSLGPELHVAGRAIGPAPWRLLGWLPLAGAMLPSRFSLYEWLGIAMLVPLWLAQPGRRGWRYLALLPCLLCLWPSRGFDRVWTTLHVPSVLLNAAAVPRGGTVLVLPYFGAEMGYQQQSGMAFRLLGQGYIGAVGQPPFAQWPLFPPLLNNQYAAIAPAAFAAFLATYGAQAVAVTASALADPAAARLLRQAGWRAAVTAPDAVLYRPTAAATK